MTTVAVIESRLLHQKATKYFTRIYIPDKNVSKQKILDRVQHSLDNWSKYHKQSAPVVTVFIESNDGNLLPILTI